jgi:hypothetical protein
LREHALDQHLDRTAALLAPEQTRLDDLGVVEDEQVAARQQRGQVAKRAVCSAGRSRNARSAGCAPVPSSKRDALRSGAGCCAISSGGSS